MNATETVDRPAGAEPARLSLEHWPISRLLPSPRNARTHSDAQIAEIAGSIRTFGFSNPILFSEDGDVIAGHGRLAAARQLGLAEVPVIPLRGLSEVQRLQLVLADNRIALTATCRRGSHSSGVVGPGARADRAGLPGPTEERPGVRPARRPGRAPGA